VPALALLLLGAVASGPGGGSLLEAAREGNLARIEVLLSQGSEVDAQDASGETALLLATRSGSTEAVLRLLKGKANPNLATRTGLTPLIEAAYRGRTEIARILIEGGAALDARDRGLGTAIDAARRAGRNEVVSLLLERGARGSGKSPGDTVCVEVWGVGQGFCGVVRDAAGADFTLEVSRLSGCSQACSPSRDCSEGRWVGGGGEGSVGPRQTVRVKSWCLTRTGARPGR
jgi:hypothetical protein